MFLYGRKDLVGELDVARFLKLLANLPDSSSVWLIPPQHTFQKANVP